MKPYSTYTFGAIFQKLYECKISGKQNFIKDIKYQLMILVPQSQEYKQLRKISFCTKIT